MGYREKESALAPCQSTAERESSGNGAVMEAHCVWTWWCWKGLGSGSRWNRIEVNASWFLCGRSDWSLLWKLLLVLQKVCQREGHTPVFLMSFDGSNSMGKRSSSTVSVDVVKSPFGTVWRSWTLDLFSASEINNSGEPAATQMAKGYFQDTCVKS